LRYHQTTPLPVLNPPNGLTCFGNQPQRFRLPDGL
jgi:hypothetical protein